MSTPAARPAPPFRIAVAGLLAESDAQAAKDALYDDSSQLSGLIERPTTPLAQSVKAALV